MENFVEILTENGIRTGQIINKFDAHKQGICHGISAIGLINKYGKLLIQERAKTKKVEPSKWDLSGAGHISVNETPKTAAIREIYEELGIVVKEKDLKLIDTYLVKVKLNKNTYINHFTYLYIVIKDIDCNNLILRKEEVTSIRFVNKNEYIELLNEGKMVEGIKYCDKILHYIR